jgi:hypothetical protein
MITFPQEAARAKQLRAKFEEWEQGLGEDGGYTNLVDEDGHPLETASKLKNRWSCQATWSVSQRLCQI